MEDLGEPVQEGGVAGDTDGSARDRLTGADLPGHQTPELGSRLQDEIGPGQGPLTRLEDAVVDAGVDDDLAQAQLSSPACRGPPRPRSRSEGP